MWFGFCHLFGTDSGRYVNSLLRASYGARGAYAFSLLKQCCQKWPQTTSEDRICPLVWSEVSMGVETWAKQPTFEALEQAYFMTLLFFKCAFNSAFKPIQQPRLGRASGRSVPRVKWHVAKLMLDFKAWNVTLKWNPILLLVGPG